MSEFSEENIAFYLACEDYRATKPSKLSTKAKKIYDEFIGAEAPREVNDSRQSVKTFVLLVCPDVHVFCSSPGQSGPRDKSRHQGAAGEPQPVVLRPGPVQNLRPDGEGLLPSLPQVLHVSGALQKVQDGIRTVGAPGTPRIQPRSSKASDATARDRRRSRRRRCLDPRGVSREGVVDVAESSTGESPSSTLDKSRGTRT